MGMTEKRFRVQENCVRSSYGIEAENWLVTNDNHSVVLNNKAEAHMVANMFNDVIDGLNELNDKNEQLKHQNDNLVNMIARVQYRADLIKEENEKLKTQLKELQEFKDNYDENMELIHNSEYVQDFLNGNI